MVNYEELYKVVKESVSKERFEHILGVVERAIEYSKVYNVNIEDAKIAAILHDIAKEYSIEKSLGILEKYEYKLDEIEKKNPNLLHAKVAAMIAKYEYYMSDDIVNSISFHTTGRANMSMLEKIVYLADATEKGRIYMNELNQLTLDEVVFLIKKDINKGLFYVLNFTLKSLLHRKLYIHNNSVEAYNFYLKK